MAYSHAASGPFRYARTIIWWTLLIGAAAAAIWAIVFGIMADSRGNYAGEDYGTARNEAVEVMALRYGAKLADNLRLGTPDVHNTHLRNSAVFGTEQVRIFHMVGPNGIRYCVPIQQGVTIEREANAIVKGCKF